MSDVPDLEKMTNQELGDKIRQMKEKIQHIQNSSRAIWPSPMDPESSLFQASDEELQRGSDISDSNLDSMPNQEIVMKINEMRRQIEIYNET